MDKEETEDLNKALKADSEYFDAPGLSSSDINRFAASPSYYHKYSGKGDTSATILGNAIHKACLQPKLFKHVYAHTTSKVSAKLGKYVETLASAWVPGIELRTAKEIAYIASGFEYPQERVEAIFSKDPKATEYLEFIKKNRGRIILSSEDYERVNRCKGSINSHKKAVELLSWIDKGTSEDGEIEVIVEEPIFWVLELKDGRQVLCKSKPDLTVIFHETKHVINVDLKSSGHRLNSFQHIIEKWGYHRQQGFYSEAVNSKLWQDKRIKKRKNGLYADRYSKESYIIAVETETALNETRVYHLNEHQLNCSLKECVDYANEIQWHEQNNLWDYPRWYYEGDGSEELTLYDEQGLKLKSEYN